MKLHQYIYFTCGQVGMMSLARFFFQWILKYSDSDGTFDDLGADGIALFSAGLVGAILLGFRIFDGVIDPIAGSIADGWVARGKPRSSLLKAGFLLPCVGIVACFWAVPGMGEALRWGLLIGGMFVFFVGYTFYAIPYWSLVEDYSSGDESRRRLLSNLLGVGLLIATAFGFVVTPMLIGLMDYRNAAVAVAIPAALLMLLPVWAAPDDASRPNADAEGSQKLDMSAVFAGLKDRAFLAAIALFAGSQVSLTIMTAGAPYIADVVLGGSEEDVALFMAPLLATAFLFFLAVPWLGRRLGSMKVVIVASLALGLLYACTGALGHGIVGTPMQTAMIVFGFGGPMVAVLLGLEAEIIAACAKNQPGEPVAIYFGVYNFIVKAMNGVGIALTGFLAAQVSENPAAVRWMSFNAGGFLVLGVGVWFFLRPRPDQG